MNLPSSSQPLLGPALPGATVLIGAAAALLFAGDAGWLAHAGRVYPYIALPVAAALAWRFRRSRLLAGALSLSVMHILLAPWLLGYSVIALGLAGVFLPAGVALLAAARDVAPSDVRARAQFAITLAPFAVIGGLLAIQPDPAAEWLRVEIVDPALFAGTALPQFAFVVASLSVTGAAFAAVYRRGITEMALAWLTLAMLLALLAPVGSVARNIWTLAAALVLIVALIETSYALAFSDELTGLPARRALNHALATLGAPYTIAAVDIDHFKSFNDRHGHDTGDEVLRMVASKLRAVGGGGVAYRSGGEEFTIVFPGCSQQEATPHLESVRSAIATTKFTVREKPRPKDRRGTTRRGSGKKTQPKLQVTISVGVASAKRGKSDVAAVMKAADRALYRAKENGRNQVVA